MIMKGVEVVSEEVVVRGRNMEFARHFAGFVAT